MLKLDQNTKEAGMMAGSAAEIKLLEYKDTITQRNTNRTAGIEGRK